MHKHNQIPGTFENGVYITRIAISCFGEEIAPRFDNARRFRCWEISNNEAKDYPGISAEETDGLYRVKLLRRSRIHVLICNGIEERYREMLEVDGCYVVDGVTGSALHALSDFLEGRLQQRFHGESLPHGEILPHTAELVLWTGDLFRTLGWDVQQPAKPNIFPIDLLAQRSCPFCQKPVNVAICCGAHSYRIHEEIKELKRVTASSYNARVFVHRAVAGIEDICKDFEIELVDPDDYTSDALDQESRSSLPPLRGIVIGHEKLNAN
ncbi:hypothetical protein CEE37_14935 [candidate division LCP-89 bacterium B3_LCP]|uniref:Dinitrogenase iron-molybdenum cofactor biosynthesis domain-containing protein n=1 Tax=candidate division LCP-89 bacterium B3_LCP TaxID=2012998 RepID=A0A532UNV5_UNCL8|nr:MAG: hypothetical protein CEE37_14935 [candidate division LCP-89 bacterium B3_LCP]